MIKRRSLVRLAAVTAMMISLLLMCTVNSSAQTYDNEIQLSNSDYFIKTISISKDTVKLTGVTSDSNYSYMMLRLLDSNGKEVMKTVKARTSKGECIFSIKGISEGMYKVCIYHGPEEYGSFAGDLFGNDVHMELSSSGEYFDIPEAMPWNDEYDSSSEKKASLSAEKSVESDSNAIINLASDITADCTTDYEKAKAIHDWVCRNIYYDYDAANNKAAVRIISALDVISARHACCDGFSNLTTALLRASGIPAKTVMGYAFKNGFTAADIKNNHEWVEAYIDDRWITIDTAWDTENRWEHGAKAVTGTEVKERYFDPSAALMSIDHAYNMSHPIKTIDLYVGNPRMWNGNEWVDIDDNGTSALIINGRTLVPIRKIVESMDGTVAWDGSTRNVFCQKGSTSVSMYIDKTQAVCNGRSCKMDVGPSIINGRTMIPVRFLAEALNCQVHWYPTGDCWEGKIEIM